MNILITNDDGYNSELLYILIDSLKENNNLYIYVPKTNQSGQSSKVSLEKKVFVEKLNNNIKIIQGSPLDCVLFGMEDLERSNISLDLIISGINKGLNYGNTIYYSGTFGAALEATIKNIPSIAISFEGNVIFLRNKININKMVNEFKVNKKYKCLININIKLMSKKMPIKLISEYRSIDENYQAFKVEYNNKKSFTLKSNTASINSNISSQNFIMVGCFNRYKGYLKGYHESITLNKFLYSNNKKE
ncbi:hypothetical protein GZH82_00235 [Staphylococcus ursi]|uniref:5'/3'-nucleotidase SurE n=1 Tax=Staphylococcus sp. MI 10-1553 TaxID=1912064 RepID=UPI001397259E|nr:5'/3'-nucleotidase SurE [Staphylococcus sp. MI 10-1553]QHW35920.1 hypothetical protein GZH82_00235 [Staphylococcus sp. MI 10-1553]